MQNEEICVPFEKIVTGGYVYRENYLKSLSTIIDRLLNHFLHNIIVISTWLFSALIHHHHKPAQILLPCRGRPSF